MKLLLIIYITFLCPIYSQVTRENILDESYTSIYKLIGTSDKNSDELKIYLNAFLKKAEAENNWDKIVQGYKNYLHYSPIQYRSMYADSMILKALQSEDKLLIASSYLTKGIVYYGQKEYEKAMDNYGIANEYFLKSNQKSPYLKYKIKYNIGLMSYFLEQFDDALSELSQCLHFFESKNTKAYLSTLHSIGLCHRSMGNYELASDINKLGIGKGIELADQSLEVYFKHSEGINQYYKKHYQEAIYALEKMILPIEKLGDFANVTLGHYYLGKSYWALGKSEDAIYHLTKVDESYSTKGYIKLEFLDAYDILKAYYGSVGDQKMQQCYNQQSDKIKFILLARNNKLFSKINKKYNLANITQVNKDILERKKRNERIFIFCLLLLSVSWYYRYNYVKSSQNEKYLEQKNSPHKEAAPIPSKISEGVRTSVLKYLERFEKNKKYLSKNIRLSSLASACDTNPYYLSQIILHEKGKKYTDYINELKLSFIIEMLETNKKYRRLSIKGLAEEAHFSSVQNFGKVFKLKTGMCPSEFIRGLENAPTDKE